MNYTNLFHTICLNNANHNTEFLLQLADNNQQAKYLFNTSVCFINSLKRVTDKCVVEYLNPLSTSLCM